MLLLSLHLYFIHHNAWKAFTNKSINLLQWDWTNDTTVPPRFPKRSRDKCGLRQQGARPSIVKLDPRKCQLCGIVAFLSYDLLQIIETLLILLRAVSFQAGSCASWSFRLWRNSSSFSIFPINILATKEVWPRRQMPSLPQVSTTTGPPFEKISAAHIETLTSGHIKPCQSNWIFLLTL